MDKITLPYNAKNGDMTIGELRMLINSLPEDFDEREVWVETGMGYTNCVTGIWALNKSNETYDLLFCFLGENG